MRDSKVIIIGSHVSPSTHISTKPHQVTKILYDGSYGKPVFGEIIKEDVNYVHFKDFFSSDVIRIGHSKINDIRSAQLVEDVRDITAWRYYNKPKGPKHIETRYIEIGINDKAQRGDSNNSDKLKVIASFDKVGE